MNSPVRRPLFLLLSLAGLALLHAQRWDFRLMEYNVENLFDTLHAPGRQDADFTPEGSHHWNT